MKTSRTATGKKFRYSGSVRGDLTVFHKRPYKTVIPKEAIDIIRKEISERSPVLMGATRQKPYVANSVGKTLATRHKRSPQFMSYVVPLLVREGFCTVRGTRPVVIQKSKGERR